MLASPGTTGSTADRLARLADRLSVGLCIGLRIRAKTVDQDERGNAQRRAMRLGCPARERMVKREKWAVLVSNQ